MEIYGYCRVSTKQQSIDRQERNIRAEYPNAHIIKEAYTGTRIERRKEPDKLLKTVKPGDTIVFDSVSRMSRNTDEGITLYEQLFYKGIELVFLRESYINTATYKEALQKQIELAFEQAEKEVRDLHQRTAEGIETARLAGKQIGQKQGAKLNVNKKAPAMEQIKKYSKDFDGTLKDTEVMQLVKIARNTYYKYKRELMTQQQNEVNKSITFCYWVMVWHPMGTFVKELIYYRTIFT